MCASESQNRQSSRNLNRHGRLPSGLLNQKNNVLYISLMVHLGHLGIFTDPRTFQRISQRCGNQGQEPCSDRSGASRQGVLLLTAPPQSLEDSGSQWTGTKENCFPPLSPVLRGLHCSPQLTLVLEIELWKTS